MLTYRWFNSRLTKLLKMQQSFPASSCLSEQTPGHLCSCTGNPPSRKVRWRCASRTWDYGCTRNHCTTNVITEYQKLPQWPSRGYWLNKPLLPPYLYTCMAHTFLHTSGSPKWVLLSVPHLLLSLAPPPLV